MNDDREFAGPRNPTHDQRCVNVGQLRDEPRDGSPSKQSRSIILVALLRSRGWRRRAAQRQAKRGWQELLDLILQIFSSEAVAGSGRQVSVGF